MTSHSAFFFGGETIQPGERKTIELPVAYLYTHHDITMPVKVVHGKKPGPVLFVSGALHGDEINGVEIIARLLKLRLLDELRGTLLAVPVVNVYGFLNHSRYLPDRRDLNRSFPGSGTGSMAARMADLFVQEIVSRSQYGVDLHTGAIHRSNLPQLRMDLEQPGNDALARAFGAPVVLNSGMIEGSLREVAHKKGVRMVVYECGEALRFDELGIQVGVRGITRLMRHIGMLPNRLGRSTLAEDVTFCYSSRWVRAPIGGVMRSSVKLGDHVPAQSCLGYVGHPLGTSNTPIYTERGGIVVGMSFLPLVDEGNALFHLATPEAANSEIRPEPDEVIPEEDMLRQTRQE